MNRSQKLFKCLVFFSSFWNHMAHYRRRRDDNGDELVMKVMMVDHWDYRQWARWWWWDHWYWSSMSTSRKWCKRRWVVWRLIAVDNIATSDDFSRRSRCNGGKNESRNENFELHICFLEYWTLGGFCLTDWRWVDHNNFYTFRGLVRHGSIIGRTWTGKSESRRKVLMWKGGSHTWHWQLIFGKIKGLLNLDVQQRKQENKQTLKMGERAFNYSASSKAVPDSDNRKLE